VLDEPTSILFTLSSVPADAAVKVTLPPKFEKFVAIVVLDRVTVIVFCTARFGIVMPVATSKVDVPAIIRFDGPEIMPPVGTSTVPPSTLRAAESIRLFPVIIFSVLPAIPQDTAPVTVIVAPDDLFTITLF
jgi:hypothetical protein